MNNKVLFSLIILLSSVVILWNISTGSLMSWDECLYGQVSREMYRSGNWMDLTWMGKPWCDKPPLYMWVTVLFFKLFGITELSVRLFSSLCGIGTVGVVYLLAQKLYSRNAAITSALFLLTTWHFIWSSKIGMLDAAFTFFVTLSIYWFMVGEEKSIFLTYALLAFAAAFLTKGITALIIPVIILAYMIAAKKMFLVTRRTFIVGMVVAVIAIGIWHAVALMHYGRQFTYDYFIRHLFVRTTQVLEGHAGTGAWSSYLEAIPNKGRPWGGFGLFMMIVAGWRVLIKKEKNHLLPLLWAMVVLVLFSLAKTKNHWYIIPIYPAFALMLGWGASRLFKGYAVAAVAMLTLSALIYLSFEKRIFKLDYSPEAKRMALSVKAQLPQHEKVYLYRMSDPGMLFYFGDVFEDIPENRIKQLLSEPNRYIAMERNTLSSLGPFRYAFAAQSKDFVVVKTQP